jgi:DNA-binding response OmpR family regulator
MPHEADVGNYSLEYPQATSANIQRSGLESGAGERKLRLLVVDDDPAVLTFLRLSLELDGFSVVDASDGAGALSCLTNDIDALITDLTMPNMDGLELISRVRQIRQDLPVLIVSGNYGQYSNRLTGLNWLQKPFAIGEVGRRVRELIARPEGCERHFQTGSATLL